jgi:hypothetical protein
MSGDEGSMHPAEIPPNATLITAAPIRRRLRSARGGLSSFLFVMEAS